MPDTLLITLVGPTGAGKSKLMHHLAIVDSGRFRKVRNVTTRPHRFKEDDDSPYAVDPQHRFVDYREFDRLIEAGSVVQHAKMNGHRYGLDLEYTRLQLGSKHGLTALTREGLDLLAEEPDLAPRLRIVAVMACSMVIHWNLAHGDSGIDDVGMDLPIGATRIGPHRIDATIENFGRTDSIHEMAESLKHQLGIKDED